MKPRAYQTQRIDEVLAAFAEGHRVVLLVAATGSGKTIIAAHIAKAFLEKGRVMVLAHRDELLRQAEKKFTDICGVMPSIEKAAEFSPEDSMHGKPQIVVSSVQTHNSGGEIKRMTRFDPLEFSLLWIDEAHRSVSETYIRCIEHYRQNPDLCVLLVTATPDRADKRGLKEICDKAVTKYEITDAIQDGYLVPVRQRRVTIEGLDFAKIATVGGDFDAQELEAAMLIEKPLHGTAHATIESACQIEVGYLETIRDDPARTHKLAERMADKRPLRTVVFCTSVSHSERMAEIIERWLPKSSACISGNTDASERARVLRAFRKGEISFLINCMLLTEGWDEAGVEMISIARPTKSRVLYSQMVGRGTRPEDIIARDLGELETPAERRSLIQKSGKPWITILDFVGNSGKHKLICTADILGTARPIEVVERATELAEDDCDMMETLERAQRDIDREQDAEATLAEIEAEKMDIIEEVRVSAAARRRMNVVATANYSVRNVSAFEGQPEAEQINTNLASPAQQGFLIKLGVSPETASGYSRRQASAVIEKLKETRCTTAQGWALKRAGYGEGEIQGMNFDAASAAIDAHKRGVTA